MIPEIALLLLITSTVFAGMQMSVAAYQARYCAAIDLQRLKQINILQISSVVVSYLLLTYAFWMNDFSVLYVAQHSHGQLPALYRLSAVWGAHEGSLLLWLMILGLWQIVVARSSGLASTVRAWMLSVLALIHMGFAGFILITSNPFLRDFSLVDTAGQDLNPLLQDPGLVIHPPLLYAGYVGMAVCFAFAIAVLLQGKTARSDFIWLRKWLLLAWSFLTAGITLGSWWAYRVLGWGGWWFWDPVENASFLPWLAATALLHSLVMVRKNSAFLMWTLFLCLCAFSLSLLGTFLVRSGVLSSVHAFASDPSRGVAILLFFILLMGGALALFIYRLGHWPATQREALLSKQFFLLLNSVLLFCVLLAILIGTLYPLIIESLTGSKLSVGAPYFNRIFIPFALLILFLMGSVWLKKTTLTTYRWPLSIAFVSSLVIAVFMLRHTAQPLVLGSSLTLTLWILAITLITYQRERSQTMSRSFLLPTLLSHVGVVIVALGIMLSSSFSVQRDVKLAVGDSMNVGPYRFKIVSMKGIPGPNYQAMRLDFMITQAETGRPVATTSAEKRLYTAQNTVISHPGIVPGLWRDLYVAIGEPIPPKSWTLRLYYKPFVRWIWAGGLLIMLGGIVGFCSTTRRQSLEEKSA